MTGNAERGIEELKKLGRICRGDIIKMTTIANSGHPGGSMSSIDMYLSIYNKANINPSRPYDPNRDRVIVSHGHTSPGVYAALGRLGFFNIDDVISGFRHAGSIFEGHITRGIPGVEWTTGNLGQGLSVGVGMALTSKLTGRNFRVFVAMSDAEQAKGQVSEARRTAVKYRLNNLVVVIDYNDAQISGRARDIMYVDIKANYLADGWDVIEVNGHDYHQIMEALSRSFGGEKPVAVICRTVMGKGISFMEGDVSYHGKPLSFETAAKALEELGLENDLDRYAEMRKALPSHHEPVKPVDEPIKPAIGTPITYPVDKKTDNRSAFGKALADIGKTNRNGTPVVVFDCDLKPSTKVNEFEKVWPENFIQIGVQEHNAAVVAGAASVCGTLSFFADFGVFGIDETYNQQRLNDINKANVKVAVTHVGIDVGEDGKTHHCLDYIGALRNFFGFGLIVPADPNQTDRAVRYMSQTQGNCVIAMGRSTMNPIADEKGGPFFGDSYKYEYGKIDVIRKGKGITLLSTGQVTHQAVLAADQLKKDGLEVTVLNLSAPLASDLDSARDYLVGTVITLEDHNVNTGLASIVEEYFVREGFLPEKFVKIGVDRYMYSGDNEKLYDLVGLSRDSIVEKVREILRQ
jgi:transketolase